MLASGSILLAVTFVSLDCISPLDSECDKGNDRDWLIAMLLVHARLLSLWHENHCFLYFPSPMGNTYHMLSFSFTKFTIIDKMSILVTL